MKPRSFLPMPTVALLVFGGLLASACVGSSPQPGKAFAVSGDSVPPQFDCLAAGTMIEMANGRSAAIESVHAGDKVYSPYDHADSALAVMDATKGTEKIPMIRIEDEHGRSLLLTETHPVHLPGRGMVMGKSLKVGDVVTTKNGPSRLVHVSRERFTGTVHNLKVGDSAEIAKLAKDQTAMYANGFLVGDSRIQKANDLVER